MTDVSTHCENDRVAELLAEMTLAEKIGQMSQVCGEPDSERLQAAIAAGQVGALINLVDAEAINQLQTIAVEKSRLGIPLLAGRDVIHGFRTIFPIPLGQAASWNPELARQCARVAAIEAAAHGVNWTFAPMLDVTRDPRWGRIAESPGEDPYLASQFATALVHGYQGDDLGAADAIVACAKHFAGYGACEAGRDYAATFIPENELFNVYLPSFQAAVDAGVATVMTSFSDLNGVPATGNDWLMRDVLREQWGFSGFVVSDWRSIPQLSIHGLTADDRQSAVAAARAGVNMEMTSAVYRNQLPALVEAGELDEAAIDELVAAILRIKFRLGLFDQPYTRPADLPKAGNAQFLDLAKQAALESLVLLRNERQVLPVDAQTISSLAVIGPLADDAHEQLGTWVFDADPDLCQTPLSAISRIAAERFSLHVARGVETTRSLGRDGFDQALDAAKKSDLVLMFVGEESILSGEAHCRADINLPGVQEELVRAVAQLGKPLVLIIMAGRPLTLSNVVEHCDAILYAWHPGTMAGPAIADVLFGARSPVGRLPVTFPRAVGQIPIYHAARNTGKPPRPEDVIPLEEIPARSPQTSVGNTSYHLDAGFTPLFAFGFGLTYTRFTYANIHVSSARVPPGATVEISAEVTNQGQRAGLEVVQLYVRDLVGSVTRPVRELKGFRRVRLEPGETKRVSFELTSESLAFFDRQLRRVTEPGQFHAWIGGNSQASLRTEFEVA